MPKTPLTVINGEGIGPAIVDAALDDGRRAHDRLMPDLGDDGTTVGFIRAVLERLRGG